MSGTTIPRRKRLPMNLKAALRRASGWTLIGLVLALALIGFLQVTRGTAVRHVQGVGTDGASVGVSESEFPLMVSMLAGAALAPGHRVEVVLNGDGTYPRLWDDLRSAQRSITLQLYYGAPGRMAAMLGDVLRERLAAGVRVYILYDAFGTVDIPESELAAFRAAGAHVEPFRPIRLSRLHLAQNRSHVRGIVIDGRIGWTGGFGIDDKWFGDGYTNGWRETNVRFEGPAVRQLEGAFAAAWAEATGVLFTGRLTSRSHEDGVPAGLLYTTPTLGSTAAERFLALSIAGARTTLYITNPYFVLDANFIEMLAATAGRGVDVRILTAGPKTDVPFVRLAGRGTYDRLLDAGVRIYEWQPTTLHAKTFVVDGEWSAIGSMNFDNRSMALNDESTLMVLDLGIGAQMVRLFLEDLRHATEITAAEFRRRSWRDRSIERAANLLTRIL
jgi:cardiolipin synthase